LHDARGIRTINAPEPRVAECSLNLVVIEMIQNVEEIPSQLNVFSLCDRNALGNG